MANTRARLDRLEREAEDDPVGYTIPIQLIDWDTGAVVGTIPAEPIHGDPRLRRVDYREALAYHGTCS